MVALQSLCACFYLHISCCSLYFLACFLSLARPSLISAHALDAIFIFCYKLHNLYRTIFLCRPLHVVQVAPPWLSCRALQSPSSWNLVPCTVSGPWLVRVGCSVGFGFRLIGRVTPVSSRFHHTSCRVKGVFGRAPALWWVRCQGVGVDFERHREENRR